MTMMQKALKKGGKRNRQLSPVTPPAMRNLILKNFLVPGTVILNFEYDFFVHFCKDHC